ncbi:MAG TPA: zeta toxin family protein [Patescibacteria group bacterium]|nr:zeta toxin family protein [Patescibacteria group bacterium]
MNISENAYHWVNKNEKFIINKFVNGVSPTEEPISFFMAGSPGSGKTEYSKSLIKDLNMVFQNEYKIDYPIVRIDIDDVRPMCPGYNGKNASLFQRASVLAANRIQDYVLKKEINFLFDGTFSNEKYAIDNIERSVKKGRKIQIFYLFQDPINAWKLTLARQNKDGRAVPLDVFINDYFLAKEVVNKIKALFLDKVTVDLVIKDYFNNTSKIFLNINNIDNYMKLPYTKTTLKEKLSWQ